MKHPNANDNYKFPQLEALQLPLVINERGSVDLQQYAFAGINKKW